MNLTDHTRDRFGSNPSFNVLAESVSHSWELGYKVRVISSIIQKVPLFRNCELSVLLLEPEPRDGWD
jgi:hypothetical protein